MDVVKLLLRVTIPATPPNTAELVPYKELSAHFSSSAVAVLYQFAVVLKSHVPFPPDPPVKAGSHVKLSAGAAQMPTAAKSPVVSHLECFLMTSYRGPCALILWVFMEEFEGVSNNLFINNLNNFSSDRPFY